MIIELIIIEIESNSGIEKMKDRIITYREMCDFINIDSIQKGMNFHIKGNISVILMSVRSGAPYDDEIDEVNNLLIYEGHDVPKTLLNPSPKEIDQKIYTKTGKLTENGKFIKAVDKYKKGIEEPEKVLVFEKLKRGIWSEKGLFILIDYAIEISNN